MGLMVSGSKATADDRRWKKAIAKATLALLLLANAALLAINGLSRERGMPFILYGLNTLVTSLLLCTIVLPGPFTEKNPFHGLTTPFFFAVVGTCAGIAILLSAVVTAGDDFTINGPLAFVASIATLATYVYYCVQREYSKTWKASIVEPR